MLELLALLAMCSTFADWGFTCRRIKKYGLQVEMNPLMRWLARWLTPVEATFIATVLTSWVIIATLVAFRLEIVLAIYTGARLFWNWQQFASLRCEAQLDKWLEEMNGQADQSKRG